MSGQLDMLGVAPSSVVLAPLARPVDARANLDAYITRIRPTLKEREQDVIDAMVRYLGRDGFTDVTGGELAAFSGLPVTSIRPRLTTMAQAGVIRVTASTRPSTAKNELPCHAYYFPTVPPEVV